MNSFKDYLKDFFTSLKLNYPKILFWSILFYSFYILYYQYFLETILWAFFSNIQSYLLFNILNLILGYPLILGLSLILIRFNSVINNINLKSTYFIKSLNLSFIFVALFLILILLEELYYLSFILVILSIILMILFVGIFFFYQKHTFKKGLVTNLFQSLKDYFNQKKLLSFLIFVLVSIILFTIYYLSFGFIFFDFVSVFIFAFFIFCFIKLSTH